MTDARTEAVKTALKDLFHRQTAYAQMDDIATTAIAALDAYDREHRAAGVVTEEMLASAQKAYANAPGEWADWMRPALEAALAVAPVVKPARVVVTRELADEAWNICRDCDGDGVDSMRAALEYAFAAASEAPPAEPAPPDTARAARLRELDAEVARTAEVAAAYYAWSEGRDALRAIAAAARARAEG